MVDRVALPLTGSGDTTASVATERIAGDEFQWVKIADGTAGQTRGFIGASTTPESSALGLVTRNIPGGIQAVDQAAPWVIVGAVSLDPSTAAIGTVAQGTPGSSASPWFFAGSVSVSSGSVTLAASTALIGTVAQGSAGSSNSPWWVISTGGGAGSTAVDANLTSAGSTKLVGTVALSSGQLNIGTVGQGTAASSTGPWPITGSVLISSGTQTIGTVLLSSSAVQIGAVALSSGTQTIGTVVQGSAGSSTQPWYFVGSSAGSSANMIGTVVLSSGTTAITAGSVALLAGSSANMVGTVMISSASPIVHRNAVSASRTSAATSVDVALFAANANSLGRTIFNETTGSLLYIGLSTVLVSSTAYDWQIPAGAGVSFGMAGGLPPYTGAVRGRLQSTTIAGVARMTEFTS